MNTFLRAVTFWEFMNFLDSWPFAGWRKVRERKEGEWHRQPRQKEKINP